MKIRVGLARSLSAIVLVTVSASGAGLEQPDRIDPPTHPRATVVRGSPATTRVKNFGTQDSTLTVVSAVDFHAFFSLTEYTYSSGFRAATGPVNFQLGATFGDLPHGAVMESFTVYYSDSSATEELRFRACRNSRDTVSGDINLQECFVEYFTSGEPDFSVVELPVPAEFQNYLLVTDTDGDLDDDSVDYFFVVDTPGGLATAIGPVMIRWRRQVSPAPSLGDVQRRADLGLGVPVHRGAFGIRHHGRLRRRKLLSRFAPDPSSDGGVPGQGARIALGSLILRGRGIAPRPT